MNGKINVLFKSQQKDDKKEVLKFEIKGSENGDIESYWYSLAGSIIIFNIEGSKADNVTGEFMSMQRDSKKTVVKLAIKGDNDEKAGELYRFAGRNVSLTITSSQMSIEDFYKEDDDFTEIEGGEEPGGLEFQANPDGTVELKQEPLDPMTAVESDKVTDIRAPRVTKTEKAAKAAAEAEKQPDFDDEDDPDKLPM